MKIQSVQAALERYGQVDLAKGIWADAYKWCAVISVPQQISKVWINSLNGAPTEKIYCNKDMIPSLLSAWQNIIDGAMVGQLKTMDGCWNVRKTRGGEGISAHAFALAIDINSGTNVLGQKPGMTPGLVKCFTDAGFDWGGNFARCDGMHFSYCWEY